MQHGINFFSRVHKCNNDVANLFPFYYIIQIVQYYSISRVIENFPLYNGIIGIDLARWLIR